MRSWQDIALGVGAGERLSIEDALVLWRDAPLWRLGELALERKRKVSGDKVFYNRNFHLEPTNVCLFNCKFCSFRRPRGSAEAWEWSMEQMREQVKRYAGSGVTEVHIVGGVHPDHSLDYYCDLIRMVKQELPDVAVKAYTAIELSYMIQRAGVSVREGLQRLIDAGMEAIPGGGAEIFDEEVRSRICPDKGSTAEWFEVHRTAHELGIKTNATMLYGHIEELEHRIDHLMRLRQLQDMTHGFNAFIPLKYRNFGNSMSEIGEVAITDDLRTLAMSRLILDNVPHIKAYWVMYGRETTEMALMFGADDIDGTIDDSTKIYSMAGAEDKRPRMSVKQMREMVSGAGFSAVERDTHYNELNYTK